MFFCLYLSNRYYYVLYHYTNIIPNKQTTENPKSKEGNFPKEKSSLPYAILQEKKISMNILSECQASFKKPCSYRI
ncbi:MAG: hypothetical protein LBI60_05940 [Bacteroidales bacterium]|jgi:hypothetical protein|nr:hypothetical protein [Bacteroidales bacterium]